jgi:signal transduction histidine kinase
MAAGTWGTSARADRVWAASAAVLAVLAVLQRPTAPLFLALIAVGLLPWLLEGLGRPLPLAAFAPLAVVPVLGAVLLVGYGTVMFLLTLAASRIASRTDSRAAVAAIAVVGATAPLLHLLPYGPDAGIVYFAIGNLFGVLLGVLLRRTIRLADDLRAADARLVEAAGRAERERIARDVHDLVAHSLTVVVLHVGGARRVLRADPAAAERALEDAERVCRDSLDGIRGVVGLLRGPDDSSVLSLDLDTLASTYRSAGLPVTLTVSGDPTGLPLVTRVTLYRVLQESLANAARHAGPGAVSAAVAVTGDTVTARVENPLGPASSGGSGTSGFGLAGLREQVAAQSGELSGGPEGGTWAVRCRLPIPSPSPIAAVRT